MAKVNRYGSAAELLKRFNPQAQAKAMSYEMDMFQKERFPTMSDLKAVHGTEIAIDWLIIQIDDALNSSGVTTMKARTEQITDLAYAIYIRYHYLTLPEMLLFFYKFKNGDFGDFNGVFNQQRFMKTFNEFKKYRFRMQIALQQAASRQQNGNSEKTVTRSEYLQLKEKNARND